MARFQPLVVTDVRKTIRDAVVVSLAPQNGDTLEFIPGQYLTFRRDFDGTEVRRSYSICTAQHEGQVQVGIKRVDGGAFSTWANTELRAGMIVEAMPPMGNFHAPLAPQSARSYLGFAGGSGITPVLSILKTVLAKEPLSRFTLIYANRAPNTIMFREDLEDLKNLFMGRLNIIHVLENGSEDTALFQGRVDEAKCAALFETLIDIANVDLAFICGPQPMMLGIVAALNAHGLTDDQIKFELFASNQPGRLKHVAARAAEATSDTQITVVLDGASNVADGDKGTSVLQAALNANIDAPYACTAGVCSTCKCKVLEGEVEMIANHALEDYEVEAGFVLSCQSYPLTDKVVVDYDQH